MAFQRMMMSPETAALKMNGGYYANCWVPLAPIGLKEKIHGNLKVGGQTLRQIQTDLPAPVQYLCGESLVPDDGPNVLMP